MQAVAKSSVLGGRRLTGRGRLSEVLTKRSNNKNTRDSPRSSWSTTTSTVPAAQKRYVSSLTPAERARHLTKVATFKGETDKAETPLANGGRLHTARRTKRTTGRSQATRGKPNQRTAS